jgi:hypothetical protein
MKSNTLPRAKSDYGAVLNENLIATQTVNQLPILKNTTASLCVLKSL